MQPEQNLVLTKPLGIGVISTAQKQGKAGPKIGSVAAKVMTQLNSKAAKIALEHGVEGATDVTGFGLLGHLGRAALESSLDVTIEASSVPLIEGVAELAAEGLIPGGSRRNLTSIQPQLDAVNVDPTTLLLLADAQTSGGLVFTVSKDQTEALMQELSESGHTAAVIGTSATGNGKIVVR